MDTPVWALSLAYWLHMLATVVWIGGLTALAFLVFPAARRSLDNEQFASLAAELQRRLDPLAWFSLAVLVGTGLVQMSATEQYGGFLVIDNRWAVAILAKHAFIFGMVAISAYLTWGVLPRLRRLALLQQVQEQQNELVAQDLSNAQRAQSRLLTFNLILSIIVLALTALARVS